MRRTSLAIWLAFAASGCGPSRSIDDSARVSSRGGQALEFKTMARRYLDEARIVVELSETSPTSAQSRNRRASLADLFTRIPLPDDEKAAAATACIKRIHSSFIEVDGILAQTNLAMNTNLYEQTLKSIQNAIQYVRQDIVEGEKIVEQLR